MSTPPPTGTPERSTRWRTFAVCVAVASLTILDLSKVNVGIPAIEDALGAGPTELQLIVAGYALSFGLVLVPAGRYGDVSSRRRMFLIGLFLFSFASLACALAPSALLLVVARILQGVAAGVLMPQVLGLIQQLFVGPDRGRAFGLFGAVIGLSTAFGPTLGGFLVAIGGPDDGWRLLFWMNVPLGVIMLVVAARLLPTTQPRDDAPTTLDLVGVLLLGAAVLSLMLPFVLTTGGPADDARRWWWLVPFLGFLFVFVLWETRYTRSGRTAVVDFGLFRRSSFRNGVLVGMTYFAAMPGTFLVLMLYVQQGLGLEAVYAGMITIPFALASAVSSWWSGRRVDRIGRPLVIGGLALVILGFGGSAALGILLPPQLAPWGMAAVMLVAGLGAGAVMSPNQTLMLSEVPVFQAGVAGSIAQLAQRIGTAVGLAAATAAFFATVTADNGTPLDVYHDAYRNATLVTVSFLLASLVFAVLDRRTKVSVAAKSTG